MSGNNSRVEMPRNNNLWIDKETGDIYSYSTVIKQMIECATIGNKSYYSTTSCYHQDLIRVNDCTFHVQNVPDNATDLVPYLSEEDYREWQRLKQVSGARRYITT